MIRLLYITPYAPSPIRVRPYELLRALPAQGVQPTVLCPIGPEDAAALAELRGAGLEVIGVPVAAGQRLAGLLRGWLGGLPLQAAYGMPAALRRGVAALVAGGGFDLVHIEHLRAAALLPLTTPLPVVYDAVDCISLLLARTREAGPDWRSRTVAALELARTREFERAAVQAARVTVVTSPEDAAALTALAPDAPVELVPNGVDLQRFSPPFARHAHDAIVFSGKLSYHANVAAAQRLVERIMPRVWAARPAAQLWLVGSAPPRSIRRYAADPRITVTGRVPDMAAYLQRATVAACPLCYGVGVQNKVLEALATATPVVVDRQATMALAPAATAAMCVADDDQSFAAALIQLLDDAALRLRLGAAGHAYVEQFHRWSQSAALLLRAYQQALESSAGPFRFGTPQPRIALP